MTTHKIKFAPINKDHVLTDATKPSKAKNFIPTWFRSMPHFIEDAVLYTNENQLLTGGDSVNSSGSGSNTVYTHTFNTSGTLDWA